MYLSLWVLVFLLALATGASGQIREKKRVVVQLSWKHQFQFAGYYAAAEKGYYQEAGLDVDIVEAQKPVNDIVEEVLSGRATYGIGNSELVIHYMHGDPIVVLASMFQHSPTVLAVRQSSTIFTPQDLIGKSIEMNVKGAGCEILAMLYGEGLKPGQFNVVETTYSLNGLLSNRADALLVYTSNEPFFLDKFGIPYRLISPKRYGIDFYSDCLFTSRRQIDKHPEDVRKFREASIRGWEYALSHPEEIARLIQTKYKSAKTFDHLLFEANELQKLILPDFIDIGHTNRGRWLHMVEVLSQQGLITQLRNIDGFIYNPNGGERTHLVRIISLAAVVVIVVAGAIFLLNRRLKRIVNQKTADLQKLTERLENQNKEITKINLDLLRAKEKAEESDRIKTTFISNLSYEIRNPMNNIIGYADLISSQKLRNEIKDQYVAEIVQNSKALLNQIENIIEIAKLEANQVVADVHQTNLLTFLNNMIAYTQSELKYFRKEHIEVRSAFDRKELDLEVLFDKNNLYMLLTRLVHNAVQYTANGHIEIGCNRINANTLQFWVSDSGEGIDKENFDGLFDSPLPRLDDAWRNGLGLGLPIAKGLVDLLGGKIWIESDKEIGTNVYFTIPCSTVRGGNPPLEFYRPEYSTTVVPDLKGKKILIVEDQYSNYLLLKTILEETQCGVYHAGNGNEAIELCKTIPDFDLVFMDLRMPEMDGIDATRLIKSINPKLIVVAQTAYSSGVKLNLCLEAGCNDFITKPLSRHAIHELLCKYLVSTC